MAQDITMVLNLAVNKGGPSAPVTMQLLPDVAPLHVERLLHFAQTGFYTGKPFHRVIPGFVAQVGDTQGDGFGGSTLGPLPLEASALPFGKGSVGIARGEDPDSGDCQFFICHEPSAQHAPRLAQLTGLYTQCARITSGMDVIEQIKPINVTEEKHDIRQADTILSFTAS